MKGNFSRSLKQLREDLKKYQHYCDDICKGECPINNTSCNNCNYLKKVRGVNNGKS